MTPNPERISSLYFVELPRKQSQQKCLRMTKNGYKTKEYIRRYKSIFIFILIK